MANTNRLKAFIRFDGQKKVVPGSLILRESKPKVGTWLEVTYDLCCGSITPPPTPVPPSPIFIYDFEIECEDFCLSTIDVNGEPFTFPVCETPIGFNELVSLLQSTFPDDIINGVAATPPATGGTITMISSSRVFGAINTENCGVITPIVSGLEALRFGFFKISENLFINVMGEYFISQGQTNTDPTTVDAWNEYYGLPANGDPFTSVYLSTISKEQFELILIGGGNMSIYNGFDIFKYNLLYIIDSGGYIISVESKCFSGYNSISQINLGGCLQIKKGAFAKNTNLVTVNCPVVTEIGNDAFANSKVSNLYLPALTDLGDGAFANCNNLSVVNISSAINIGDYAFSSCVSLSSMDMSSVVNLGASEPCSANITNEVFNGIIGNTIIIKVPTALTTCNGGGPQADLQRLVADNTVTVITI